MASNEFVCLLLTDNLITYPNKPRKNRNLNEKLSQFILTKLKIGDFFYYKNKLVRMINVDHGFCLIWNGSWVDHIYGDDLANEYIFHASSKICKISFQSSQSFYIHESYTEVQDWDPEQHVIGIWQTSRLLKEKGLTLIAAKYDGACGWYVMAFLIYGKWDDNKAFEMIRMIKQHILNDFDYWYEIVRSEIDDTKFIKNKSEFESWLETRYDDAKNIRNVTHVEQFEWRVFGHCMNTYVLLFEGDRGKYGNKWKLQLDTREFVPKDIEFPNKIIIHVYLTGEHWRVVHDPRITCNIRSINAKMRQPSASHASNYKRTTNTNKEEVRYTYVFVEHYPLFISSLHKTIDETNGSTKK